MSTFKPTIETLERRELPAGNRFLGHAAVLQPARVAKLRVIHAQPIEFIRQPDQVAFIGEAQSKPEKAPADWHWIQQRAGFTHEWLWHHDGITETVQKISHGLGKPSTTINNYLFEDIKTGTGTVQYTRYYYAEWKLTQNGNAMHTREYLTLAQWEAKYGE